MTTNKGSEAVKACDELLAALSRVSPCRDAVVQAKAASARAVRAFRAPDACGCVGFSQEGAVVHADRCGR